MTLVEFLTARLDEDEAVARAAIDDDMGETGGFEDAYEALIRPPSGVGLAQGGFGEAAARMIVTYAVPARTLREVEAKRRIIGEHGPNFVSYCPRCRYTNEPVTAPCPTLRILAAVYSDHPDYDEEWRP